MRDRLAEHKVPLTCAVQLGLMLRVEGVEGNEIRGGDWLRGSKRVGRVRMALTQLFKFFKKSAQPRPALIGRRNKVTIDLNA